MSSEQENWKRKYRELALEVEQNQLQGRLVEQQLKQLINVMSIPLQGSDARLDDSLSGLRTALQSPADAERIKRASDAVERQIRQQDSNREKQSRALLKAVLAWIQQLRMAAPDEQLTDQLAELERQGHDAVEKHYQLAEFVSSMVDLQRAVIQTDARVPANPPLRAENELSDEALAEDTELLLQRVGVELLALVEGINVPLSATGLVRNLIQKVEQGFAVSELPELLHSLTEIITKATSDGSKEFESYLLNLTVQLSEVQKFLLENQREQGESGVQHRQLEQQVRSDVRKLHDAVKVTHDIGELKKAVSQQLVGIVKAMDEFRRQEEQREGHLQQRYESLMEKVELMEEETRQVKAHMEEERHRARTDPLTGLPNRIAYDEQLSQEYERWRRYRQPFSVAVADLDFFKRINDSYGHLAGDKVLRLIGKILNRQSRSTDFIARYGGEEFVIIMPSTDAEAAVAAAEKLRQAVAESPFNFHGRPVNVTMSFGIAEIQPGEELDQLFNRADRALYDAKQGGRNRTQVG